LPMVSADLAVFYNEYQHLRTTETVGAPASDPTLPGSPLVQRVDLDNKSSAETYGAELSLTVRLLDWWSIEGAYTALEIQAHRDSDSNDADAELIELRAPHHQFRAHSAMTLPAGLRLDIVGRYVDGLPDFNIPHYFALDARLAWRPRPNLEFSITGQNLLDDRHPEFWPTVLETQRTEVQRSIFGKVEFRF
jgi:iron complex outermembrane receptor protein